MKNRITLICAAASAAAVSLLTACSSGSQGLNPVQSSSTVQDLAQADLSRFGVAPKFYDLIRSRQALRQARPAARGPKDLFVDDGGVVDIFANITWQNTGTISNGITSPDGNFVDKRGALYVTNLGYADITQYASGASTPDFTYGSNMIDPVDVTVDAHGNVYEADFDNNLGNGFVNEYKQGVDAVYASCSPGGGVEGVAVDARGDVFVAVNFENSGTIFEYSGGLRGCRATNLGIGLQDAGGLALDQRGNLIACDQIAASVDVIAPPYTSISGTFGYGYVDPFHVTINKKNSLAYVTDPVTGTVNVFTYPGGQLAAALNSSSEGISTPYGAVDGQNYVP